jgi:hypothetical protein
MAKDIELSTEQRELLARFYESEAFEKALKPLLALKGASFAGHAGMQSQNFDDVLVNRGKALFCQEIVSFLENNHKQLRANIEGQGNPTPPK